MKELWTFSWHGLMRAFYLNSLWKQVTNGHCLPIDSGGYNDSLVTASWRQQKESQIKHSVLQTSESHGATVSRARGRLPGTFEAPMEPQEAPVPVVRGPWAAWQQRSGFCRSLGFSGVWGLENGDKVQFDGGRELPRSPIRVTSRDSQCFQEPFETNRASGMCQFVGAGEETARSCSLARVLLQVASVICAEF